ncbi:MAG TPA: T9SS type A sorting domain-containing protein, partial [Prolixibacteraceae bacterium]|nr:T9SS type A sorting domain-containing protein [Prolixibacteraceae bacterium]
EIRVMGISSVSTEQQHIGSSSLMLGKPSVTCRSTNAASLCFTVPADADLNFWVKRYTPSVSGSNQQKAFIMPQYGTTPLVEIFNGDYNDSDWVNYNVDLAAYEGQVVRLLFVEEKNDQSKQQWMYIDDIAISGESVNLAPYEPSNPSPSNKATDILFTPTLGWSGGDPNGDDLTYKVYLGTNPNPSLVASVFKNSYTTSALDHTTTYYWKIVSDDGDLSTESPVWSFTTKGIPPTMESCGVDEVTSTSAKMCGKILNYNKSTVLSRGVCWSQHQSPTIDNSYAEAAKPTDEFACHAVGLLPNTTYYYCAYAVSNQGVAYGDMVSFKTLPALASVSVASVRNVLRSSATVTGNITAVNDSFVFRRGVIWSTVSGFDPSEGKVVAQEGGWTAPGVFAFGLAGLPGPGTFYFRVFAENSVGISYSDEASFTTKNTAPSIDLDSDNSKGAGGSDFRTFSTEQMPGTFICDSDAVFIDADGDVIIQLVCEIINPSDPSSEFLSVLSDNKNLTISGDRTEKVTISTSKALSYKEWTNVLRSIEYRNNQDSPHPEVVRRVQVKVSDNLDISNLATAYITMVPVNDPPVNQVKPTLNVAPVFNSTVSVVPGTWNDLLDECDGTFLYSHSWQVKDENGKIIDIDSSNREELFVDESFCSKWIRVVEKVTDQNCGGSNVAVNQAEGEWNLVGHAAQTLTLDPVPSHYFSEGYFTLSGNASSGLPVTYSVPKNKYIFISNDTVYIQNAGTIIVSGIQPGDDCYQPSPLLYKVVNIEKSGQSILYKEKVETTYDIGKMKIPAEATSHLGLTAVSSNPAIAWVENDTIFFRNTGSVTLTISQEGNQNYDPATSVVQQLIIGKGNQQIVAETDRVLYYGSGSRLLNFVSSSSLDVSVASSNPSILDIQNDLLLIRGVGQVSLTVSQQGNNLWNAAENVVIPILVKKGIQQVEVDPIGDKVFHGSPFIPVGKSSSGLEVTYSVRDTSVADVVAEEVVIKNVGETFIDFIQEGNTYWEPTSISIPLNVLKADQFIVFDSIEPQVFGVRSLPLSAQTSSGLRIDFNSSNPDVATVLGDSLLIHQAGEALITASQPGNEQYNQAMPVSVNLFVGKASQSIISHLPDSILFDHQVIFADVTSTSGLDVGILSSDEKVIKVISDSLYIVGAGQVTLLLNQLGDRNYFPAQASAIVVVSKRVGISNFENASVSVYPNPTTGWADLRIDGTGKEPLLISIVNSTGQTIKMFETDAILNPIDLSTQPPGLYFIVVRSQNIHKAQKLLIAR